MFLHSREVHIVVNVCCDYNSVITVTNSFVIFSNSSAARPSYSSSVSFKCCNASLSSTCEKKHGHRLCQWWCFHTLANKFQLDYGVSGNKNLIIDSTSRGADEKRKVFPDLGYNKMACECIKAKYGGGQRQAWGVWNVL